MNHEGAKFTKEEGRMRRLGDEVERLAYAVIGAGIECCGVCHPRFMKRKSFLI
jgi:hypothetical protein